MLQSEDTPVRVEKSIWEHQEGEPVTWYNRFCVFRELGPERTLLRAYRQVMERPDAKSVGSVWYVRAEEWRWGTRAAAYDDAERTRLREREFERRWDLREGRLKKAQEMAEMLHTRLYQLLENLTPEQANARFTDMRTLYRDLLDLERVEMGIRQETMGLQDERLDDFVRVRETFFALLGTQKEVVARRQPGEAEPKFLAQAVSALADLYPTSADAGRVAVEGGLDRRALDLSGSTLQTWHRIVTKAYQENRLMGLISLSLREFPGNARLIDLLRGDANQGDAYQGDGE